MIALEKSFLATLSKKEAHLLALEILQIPIKMSSCLSGGGRTTYGFELEMVKSPSTSTRTSHSSNSSPSSTISESSNSPLAISTRKPRTPRKRPNQTYNEAAALLSTAYPNIFSTTHFSNNPFKFSKPTEFSLEECSSPEQLLLPFPVFDEKPTLQLEPRLTNSFENWLNSAKLRDGFDGQEDFDAESILDEEIEEVGIDSIMGNLTVSNDGAEGHINGRQPHSFCYGYPLMGLGLDFGFRFGTRREVGAFRKVDERDNWWSFPTVNVGEISPRFNGQKNCAAEKKKKKKIDDIHNNGSNNRGVVSDSNLKVSSVVDSGPKSSSSGMLLKLNYDEVLNAWSDRGSPFSDEIMGSELSGSDATARERLAQIDLFGENGGIREASVQRYKEKRRTRLFSKKIRYQVRKFNADQRPRMKGRFVRSPNSTGHKRIK
ncbi:hypothetical protein Ancab_017689 [Ancistrocladus abbreviatus]